MMSSVECEHARSDDPRYEKSCRKCGRLMPPPPGTRPRSLEFEREFTEHAAKGVADPTVLIDHSEARAATLSAEYVTDPMLVLEGNRDRARDVREELSDARNHLCWLAEERQHADDEEGAHRALIALRHIVLAYNTLLED